MRTGRGAFFLFEATVVNDLRDVRTGMRDGCITAYARVALIISR
jgi:hypothetical protein